MILKRFFILSIPILVLALAACGADDDVADGDVSDGDVTDDDVTDGDTSDGDITDGDVTDGDVTDGDIEDGDTTDGDRTDGDISDGDAADGDTEDGDTTDGDVTDGDITDGDIEPGPTLTLTGANGEQVILDFVELTDLTAAEGYGGWITTVGSVVGPNLWKGPTLSSLLDLVGGLPEGYGVQFIASDEYIVPLTYEQALGNGFTVYDPETREIKDYENPLTLIISYEEDGEGISEEYGGPLRLAYISEEPDQLVEGHWWVKMLAEIAVGPAPNE